MFGLGVDNSWDQQDLRRPSLQRLYAPAFGLGRHHGTCDEAPRVIFRYALNKPQEKIGRLSKAPTKVQSARGWASRNER